MSKKVYISGAITGMYRDEYLDRFNKVEEMLDEFGYKPVNPTKFFVCKYLWIYKIIGYKLALIYDLFRLKMCDYIYIMPNSEKSNGVKKEKEFAIKNNIRFLPEKVRLAIDQYFYINSMYKTK